MDYAGLGASFFSSGLDSFFSSCLGCTGSTFYSTLLLGCGFYIDMRYTATCVITTRKSVSLNPIFSMVSSLLVVLPLKISFCDSTGWPFSILIFSLSSRIWFFNVVRWWLDLPRFRTFHLLGFWCLSSYDLKDYNI